MKHLYKLAILLVLGASVSAGGQVSNGATEGTFMLPFPIPDTLLGRVLEKNRSLQAARELYEVKVLDSRTGNAPPNPEVEFGYLFGNSQEVGDRIDFSVNQQFDFPTAYIHKSRERDLKTSQAELQYTLARQDILLQAIQLWIERIYLNQQVNLLAGRLELSEKMVENFRAMMAMAMPPRDIVLIVSPKILSVIIESSSDIGMR